MKKECLIMATIALAVLILASGMPAMVSSLTVAQSQSLVKSNQNTVMSEYQPVCPKESYNKITELYEEGLSEEEIAEELAFPLGIVNRYLEGNYTPPPCPEIDQRMPLSDCPTYGKIKNLYGEGWSEEEIAETLELPLDTVNGFLSGNSTILSSCPEPYQSTPLSECPTYSKMAKENDNQNITKLRQEIETQMKEYAWADEIEHNLLIGKYDGPPGTKEYIPPKDMPRPPTPPVEQDLLIHSSIKSMSIKENETCAGYQRFGTKVDCGRVACYTNSIPNLKDNGKEWHVLHQWPIGGENCIVITRNGDMGAFRTFLSALGGYTEDYLWRSADHEFMIGIRPEHESGQREYTQVYFWVWDLTTNDLWEKTYNLPATEEIEDVDAALEHNSTFTPNSLWKSFFNYEALDKDLSKIDLKDNFAWQQWTCPHMTNEHAEDYYDTYGPNTTATLWQRKTPVGDSYEPDDSFDHYSTMSVTSSLHSQSRSIDPAGDNDYIRFYAYAGKKYIFYTEGSTDTYGHLYDSNHNQLTYDDDSGSGLNFRIEYTIGSSGYYFLRARGYSSSTKGPYILYYKYEESAGGDLITSKSGTLSGTGSTYTFSVSGYSTVTAVMAGNENADFDLYAKWGSPPTTSSYDARGYSGTSLEYFTTSGSGTLYIMVRSYSGSGHWKCWALSGSPGANSGRKTGSLSGTGDTATYSRSGSAIGYAFNSGPDGSDFDLYTKWNSQPTTSDYDARGYSGWAQEIAGPASGSGTLYFMVRSWSGSGQYATAALIF